MSRVKLTARTALPIGCCTLAVVLAVGLALGRNEQTSIDDPIKPLVSPPKVEFLTDTVFGETSAQARISWSATDDSGIKNYQLERRTGNGRWIPVKLQNVADTAVMESMTYGVSYGYRVQAIDTDSNPSGWSETSWLMPTMHVADSADSGIVYIDGNGRTTQWSRFQNPAFLGSVSSYSRTPGHKASFKFTGGSITWIASRRPNRGKVDVWLDGARVADDVDLYAPIDDFRRGIFTRSGLSTTSPHTIEIQVQGTKNAAATDAIVDLDAFIILAPHASNAGLSEPFQYPTRCTGPIIDVTKREPASEPRATPDDFSDDDALAVQDAIVDAAPGETVYLPAGNYHFKSTVSISRSRVCVRGQSTAQTIINTQLPHTYAPAYYSGYVIGVYGGGSDVSISNFSVQGSGGKPPWGGIGVSNAQRVLVRNLHLEGWEYAGVGVTDNSKHVLVKENVIQNGVNTDHMCNIYNGDPRHCNGRGYGIRVEDEGPANSGDGVPNNNWIQGNQITGNRSYPLDDDPHDRDPVDGIRHAIIVSHLAEHNLLDGNTILNSNVDAIDLHGLDEYHNEVRNNVISGVSDAGIAFGNPGGLTGSGYDNSGPDNWVHHNEVCGSTVGVSIGYESHHQWITDNNLHDNGAGLKFYHYARPNGDNDGADDVVIRRNTIHRNKGAGIVLRFADRVIVEYNSVTHNGGSGLEIDQGTTKYWVASNDFSSNGSPVQCGHKAPGAYVRNREDSPPVNCR